MKSALRSPVLRFLLLFSAMLSVALGLAAMSVAPESGADLTSSQPAAQAGANSAR